MQDKTEPTVAKVLGFIDSVLQSRLGASLSPTERITIQAAWEGKTYSEASRAAGCSVNTLKCAGSNLFEVLSGLLGESLGKHNFRKVISTHLVLPDPLPQTAPNRAKLPRCLGSILEVSHFYGRSKELAELALILESQRCIVLLGCEGIGKRSLTAKLVRSEAAQTFDHVIWRPLHYNPSPHQFIQETLQLLKVEAASEFQLSQFITVLQETRCLLVLEGVESLLASKRDRLRYLPEEYFSLFRRIIEETQSCLLLTTQVPILGLDMLALRGFPVTTYAIGGLEVEEAKKIFIEENLSDCHIWDDIIQIFGGNPLLLRLVAHRSRTHLGGRLQSLERSTICLRVIEDWLEERIKDLSQMDRGFLFNLSDVLSFQPSPISAVVQKVPMDCIERLIQSTLIRINSSENNQPYLSFNPLFAKYLTTHKKLKPRA